MTVRLVHLSDVHLGFRGLPGMERGRHRCERDLEEAFLRCLHEIVHLRPDLVLVTGDLFDRPDPPSTAFHVASRGLRRLRDRLPSVSVLLTAGERDSPANPAEPGPLAVLGALPGVEAATSKPRAIHLERVGVHALLVPHRALRGAEPPRLVPHSEARWNLLLIRGEPSPSGGVGIHAEDWSYVAIGGDHTRRSWAPHVHRAGSLERPGWDPWADAAEDKGFFSFDLDSGQGEFHPIPVRPVVDLAPVRTEVGDPEAGGRRLRELVEGIPGGIEGKVVRARLRGDLLTPQEGVPQGLVSAIRRRSAYVELHLSDDELPPAAVDEWRPERLFLPSRSVRGRRGLELPDGVTVITSPTDESRVRLAGRLQRPWLEGFGTDSDLLNGLTVAPDVPADPVSRAIWGGEGTPEELLRAVLGGPGIGGEVEDSPSSPESAGPRESDEVLERLEASLRRMREDHVEASGDLEALTMEWARDRQEADSRLSAYRDRARELSGRLREIREEGSSGRCPTCERELGEAFPGLLRTLEEEWEEVVQDGKWWKRRREQLDIKPERLRELERRVLVLQSRVADTSERVERERARAEGSSAGSLGRSPSAGAASRSTAAPVESLERLTGIRPVLRRAGGILQRLTRGRLVAIRPRRERLTAVEARGREVDPEGPEASALHFAVHLALWETARVRAHGLGGLFLWQLRGSGSEELALPALQLLSTRISAPTGARVLLLVPPSVSEGMVECPRLIVEWRPQALGGRRVVWRQGGFAGFRLEGLGG